VLVNTIGPGKSVAYQEVYLMKLFPRILILLIAAVAQPVAGAQAPPTAAGSTAGADLHVFDVVSVRPTRSGDGPIGMRDMPDGIEGNRTVRLLVRDAYGGIGELPTEDSITGLPDWAKNELFTIRAKMNAEQMAEFKKLSKKERAQRREAMLRSLLADQFKLKVHREPKQVADYDLVVAKGGAKFKERDSKDSRNLEGMILPQSNGDLLLEGFDMETFASFLGLPVAGTGRIVRDKTGLTGMYNLTLNFAFAQRPPSPGEAGDPAPSIFEALPEQLGLKLQSSTGTINLVVVDHVERPTEN
jgi:uncharacterized protein (TIGR03435 family)